MGQVAGDTDPPPEVLAPRRLRRSLVALATVAVAVAAAIAVVPGVGELRRLFAGTRPGWIALGAALEFASALAYVVAFRRVFCAEMSWSTSYKIAMAELGAGALLPVGGAGGLALGAWALRRGGMPAGEIGRKTVAFFLVTSAPSVGLLIVLGVALGVGAVPGEVGPVAALVPVAIAVAAVAGTLLLGRASARRVESYSRGALGRVVAVLRATASGVDDSVRLLRSRDAALIAGIVGYLLFDILVLWTAFKALGLGPPIAVIGIAFLIGQLGSLVPLPGGVGGVEGGLIGALLIYGVDAAPATAAVLLYRVIQLWIPAGFGAIAFIQLQRMLRAGVREIALCSDDDSVVAVRRYKLV